MKSETPSDSTENRIPTEFEINVFDSLDERSAVEDFLGKSRNEAQRLFEAEDGCYWEDLVHMGPVAFRYYLPAAVAVIRSDAAVNRPDLMMSFLTVLDCLLIDETRVSKHLAIYLADVCACILDSWDKYGTSGDFGRNEFEGDSRFRKLHLTFRRLAGQP
jgi:hypothetical protein